MTIRPINLRTTLAVAVTAVLAAVFICVSASARTITPAQYSVILAQVQSEASAAATAAAGAGRSGSAAAAIRTIESVVHEAVKVSPDEIVVVDNRPLLAQMQQASALADPDEGTIRWNGIASEIAAIRDSLPGSTANGGDPSAERASADALLSTDEFASEPAKETVWERMGEWIERELRKLHMKSGPSPSIATPSLPFVEGILIIIVVIALALIVYYIALAIRERDTQGGRRKRGRGAEVSLALTVEERELVATHNYTRLREMAADAAATGDYRSAFRLVFVATLVFLDAEGAIKLDRSKTNWEYLRSVAAYPELREMLRPFVADFDRIWYGQREAVESDYERAGEGYTAVQALNDTRIRDLSAARMGAARGNGPSAKSVGSQ